MLRRRFRQNQVPRVVCASLTFDVDGWQGWHGRLEHPQSMPRVYGTVWEDYSRASAFV